MSQRHIAIYIFEFTLIAIGFALMLTINPPLYTQFVILTGILLTYFIIGIVHHKKHHDISAKVVLEYILVSSIVFSLFIFLNISRI